MQGRSARAHVANWGSGRLHFTLLVKGSSVQPGRKVWGEVMPDAFALSFSCVPCRKMAPTVVRQCSMAGYIPPREGRPPRYPTNEEIRALSVVDSQHQFTRTFMTQGCLDERLSIAFGVISP